MRAARLPRRTRAAADPTRAAARLRRSAARCCGPSAPDELGEAKTALRAALAAAGGSPVDADVQAAVERLAALAPPGALRAAALRGNWRTVTRPEFPGGRGFDGEGRPLYTLGRATFGVLAPEATLVAFEGVENPVGGQEMHRDGAGEGEISYDFRVPLLVADGPAAGLRGELWTYGLCAPASAGAGADASGSVSLAAPRVPVRFVGGGLRYAGDGAVPVAWEDAFGASAVARDRAERSLLARVSSWAAKLMFGIETNSAGGASESGTPALLQSYAMRRAPQGYFDVLFLDDEIRVTRGNRGSLVVVERLAGGGGAV